MSKRAIRIGAVGYFVVSTAFVISPLFDLLGNRVEPRVFGLPWSLVYVLLVVAINFAALAGLYWARVVDAHEAPRVRTVELSANRESVQN